MSEPAAGRPVEVVSFGCRLNIVESETMQALAEAAGHQATTIVNTCAVTAESVRQARQTIRRLKRENPEREILVTGCAAETEGAGFRAMSEVARLVPNATKTSPAAWGGTGTGAPVVGSSDHTRAFIEIQNGCDHRCTFCIIPYGRGASRSQPAESVIARIRASVEAGRLEAVLTGVDLTSWGDDLPGRPPLGALVRRILAEVPGLARLRLSSIDCIEADDDLLRALAEEPRLMPHLHLSLQAGDDLTLKRMKRRHSRADAVAFCREARRLRPDLVLGADLIAGFPTEDEAMFENTLSLIADCGLTHLHVFPYSPRPGTPAARMPAVAREVAKARAERLRAAGDAARRAHLEAQVGRRLEVLTERGGMGRTPDFTPVRVGSHERGRLVEVSILGHDGKALLAG